MNVVDNNDYPTVQFEYTPDDYVAAYRLLTLGSRLDRTICAVIMFAVCVGFLVYSRFPADMPLFVTLLIPLLGLLGVVATGLISWKFWAAYIGRRVFRNSPLARLTKSLTLLPEGLRFTSSRGESSLLWSDFIGWRADSRSTLLFTAPRVFIIIPARLADSNFPLADVHAALALKVGPRGGGGFWGFNGSKQQRAVQS